MIDLFLFKTPEKINLRHPIKRFNIPYQKFNNNITKTLDFIIITEYLRLLSKKKNTSARLRCWQNMYKLYGTSNISETEDSILVEMIRDCTL